MSKLDLIEYQGDNQLFIWKHPIENFAFGSQLIVRESQEAIFFLNGKGLDLFGPGRHTLETQKLPFLSKLLNFGTKQLPFTAELFFINLTEQMAIKWGTDSRVQFLEPTYKFPLTLGASGEMSIRVINSRKLLLKIVGTERSLTQEKMVMFLRSILMTKIKTYIASTIREGSISIFQLDEHLDSFSENLRDKLNVDFEDYGLELARFLVTTLAKPDGEKDYERFKEIFFKQFADIAEARLRQEVEMIDANTKAKKVVLESEALAKKRQQEGYNYQTERGFDVADKVASNEATGTMTNLGVGLGMMAGVSSTIAQTTTQSLQATQQKASSIFCSQCGKGLSASAKFCDDCGTPTPKKTQHQCPKCSQVLEPSVKFCPQCGTKVG
jgi:membrane protease subunit (stomatin/prohibitin family)